MCGLQGPQFNIYDPFRLRLQALTGWNRTIDVCQLWRDLCKTSSFAQFRRQTQILILEILNVFLWLKFSPSLNLNKIERFSGV